MALTAKTSVPRVSIGLPVRDGQRFIRQAIDSILAQTMRDFELIVCDNASGDHTGRICAEYAAGDPRLRYYRNDTDLGPAANFNRCFRVARAEYFRWHAHDDVIEPEYLARCCEVLDREPETVIAYPQTVIIDESGNDLEPYDFRPRTDESRASNRFGALVLVDHRRHRPSEIFGLIRASALRQTPLHGSYARGDSVLLARLALLGRFVEVPGRLFRSRSHAGQSMRMTPDGDNRLLRRLLGTGPLPPPQWWDRSRGGKLNFPEWNLLRQYCASIGASPELSGSEQMRCYGVMLRWLALNPHKLLRDVIFAADTLVRRFINKSEGPCAPAARPERPRPPTPRAPATPAAQALP